MLVVTGEGYGYLGRKSIWVLRKFLHWLMKWGESENDPFTYFVGGGGQDSATCTPQEQITEITVSSVKKLSLFAIQFDTLIEKWLRR